MTKSRLLCITFVAAFLLAALGVLPMAARAQSLNCTLLAHVPGTGSSCWGYVNPSNGKEYAIMGFNNGTAIYNLDDPTMPRLTGFISGPTSTWREMKTYQNYCYVGTEAGGGMQIISLANPEAPFLAATYTGSGLNTIHTVTIDTLKAKLYANGANNGGTNPGCRILSLANPLAPVQIGNYAATPTSVYIHASFARNDTLWAACYYAGLVRVLNVANPAAITQIVAFSSELARTHNCWPTEDRHYLLVTDETPGGR